MSGRPDAARDGLLLGTAGQVRVLVVGDSGVGKTSLVHLIVAGQPTAKPLRTVGCSVSVKHVVYEESSAVQTGMEERRQQQQQQQPRGFFVELWDVTGHEMYKSSRSLFYNQINGVIFVHDLSRRKSRISALEWTEELARLGTFSAPSHSNKEGALPVPLLVIGNKSDIKEKDPIQKSIQKSMLSLLQVASKSRTLETARNLALKYNLLRRFGSKQDLPEYIRDPHAAGLVACAKDGSLDMQAVEAFFQQLIKRRYFTENLPALPSPTSIWHSPFAAGDDHHRVGGAMTPSTSIESISTSIDIDIISAALSEREARESLLNLEDNEGAKFHEAKGESQSQDQEAVLNGPMDTSSSSHRSSPNKVMPLKLGPSSFSLHEPDDDRPTTISISTSHAFTSATHRVSPPIGQLQSGNQVLSIPSPHDRYPSPTRYHPNSLAVQHRHSPRMSGLGTSPPGPSVFSLVDT